MRHARVAIAGCGPAGLSAALLLDRDGHDICLFERFEAVRPLGSGLMIQPTGLAVLRSLDLHESVLAAGARIERLFGRSAVSGHTVLDVRYAALRQAECFGVGIHRAALFDILYQAVRQAGIALVTQRTVTACLRRPDDRRELVFADGRRAGPFDLVIDALGTSSPLASGDQRELAYGALWASLDWPSGAGFDPHSLEQRYVQASMMAGVLPIGRATDSPVRKAAFFWSMRSDRLEAWRSAGLDRWKEDAFRIWPELAPLLDQIQSPEQLTFARYAHRTIRTPAEPGLIHIGDAWHSTSPQLGQGANMAFLDAFALSSALQEEGNPSRAAARAIDLRRRHVWLYQAMSALFTPVYQSDSQILPWLRDRVVRRFAHIWPVPTILAAMVSGLVGRPLATLGLHPPSQTEVTLPVAISNPLIVFDGECVLCSTQAQFVLRHDRRSFFRLTTAQGPLGSDVYRQLRLPTGTLETMVVVQDGRAYLHSDAVLIVASGLGWPWRALTVVRLIPKPIRDSIYRAVARNRYRWFGRRETCWRPTPDVADRVL